MAEEVLVSRLKRDPDYVKSQLVKSEDGLYVKKDTYIHVPYRYTLKGMAALGEKSYTIGIIPIIVDDKYTVMSVMSMLTLSPASISEVVIQDTNYYSFFYEKGSRLLESLEVVKDDGFTYNVFDEFIANGNIPWYIEYLDLAKIYDTSDKYAASNMPNYLLPYQLIISLLARSPQDRMKLYRYIVNETKDLNIRPDFVQLKSVMFMSKSTVNKIAGSYFDEGVMSALAYPSQKVEHIEKLLRA